MCGSTNLELIIDLGETALANSFLKKDELTKEEQKYPLRVFFCRDCYLCQLTEVVDPEILFRNYVYFSSGMPILPKHFKDYADEAFDRFVSSKDDLVVEIGSNDGLLLLAIKNRGARVLGIDPAVNIAKVANSRGVETIPEFFNKQLAESLVNNYGHAKVMIGNNVVAHINDHQGLVQGVKKLLTEDGVFIFEAPYLVDMFENYTFDTIYHEHLSYLAITPLKKLFEKYDMEIFDVKIYPVQGNSIRVFVGNRGKHPVFKSVRELLNKERDLKLDSLKTYQKLARQIAEMKENVKSIMLDLKKSGAKIAGYGAPAKGNTLLSYYGVGNDILDYLTEALPSKIGLYSPGTHIPVIDIEDARQNPPDYFLLLAWNYKDAILDKEKEFLKKGGKFIMPVGEVGIL